MELVPQTLLQSYFKRMMFVAWRDEINGRMRAGLQTEVTRLGEVAGRRGSSIWMMRKEDLIQCAYRELEMSRTQAERETVVTLRERLRQARARNDAKASATDPLMQTQVPSGLERMTHAVLILECEKRGISTAAPPASKGRAQRELKTRAAMIVDIKDHADAQKQWNMVQASAESSAPARSDPQAKAVNKRPPPTGRCGPMNIG